MDATGVSDVPAAGQQWGLESFPRTEFGPGVVSRLPEFVADLGHRRAFVVTDECLRATGMVDRIRESLELAGMECAVHDGVGANPSTAQIDRGAAAARAFGDCAVVAVGGGSPLDAGKAISLLAGSPDATAADADAVLAGIGGLPVIAVPTTSGTGAETNGFGVIEDTCAKRKVYIGHSSVVPRIAVLDPELTLTLPARVTAATGIDALVHGVESLSARGANAVSVAYAGHAVTLVSRWLPVAYRDGADLDARAQLMLGAHLAGRALTISGLGLVHGIGHAVTAHTGTPHGIALAAVFEEVMDFNAPSAVTAYEHAARAMRAGPAGAASDVDWPAAARAAVREVSGAVDVKRPLGALGVHRDLVPAVVDAAISDPVTRNNPRTASEHNVRRIVESVL